MGVSGSSQTKQAQSPASGGSLSLTTHHFYLVVLQTLLLSLLCQRHTVEGCKLNICGTSQLKVIIMPIGTAPNLCVAVMYVVHILTI